MTDDTRVTTTDENNKLDFGDSRMRPQDIVFPRVKVIQQMSQENVDDLAKVGEFYNTLTGEAYGDKLSVLPLRTTMQRIMLVRTNTREVIDKELVARGLDELSEGDGLKCRSFDMVQGVGEPGVLCDTECPLSQWRGEGKGQRKPPLCTETYNVVAVTAELGELVILSFGRSGAKVGRRIFSAIRMGPDRPWVRQFDLTTTQQKNDQGSFYVPNFTIAKEPPTDALIRQALKWAERVRGVAVDVTPVDEDAAGDGNGSDEPDMSGEKKGDDPF